MTAHRFLILSLALAALSACDSSAPAAPARQRARGARVLTQHNDAGHTGAYLSETLLNVATVSGGHFGKLFARAVDGHILGQPLYMAGISVPNQGVRDLVFVVTENNSVYAFDADRADQSSPMWQTFLGPPVPGSTLSAGTNGTVGPTVGITSTPVIDPDTNTIYVAALTLDVNGPTYFLHALDAATGLGRQHSPVALSAAAAGSGSGSADGKVSLDASIELNRPGLLLSSGVVYLAFGQMPFVNAPYHGWILGYDAATLAQRYALAITPNGTGGGIWLSGTGLSADADGNIFSPVGNGTFDLNTGGQDMGDSFLKLTPGATGLTLADWFAPHDAQTLGDQDKDMTTGALLPPDYDLIIGGDKRGELFVMDRSHMGGFHPDDDDQLLQRFQVSTGLLYNTPVYWQAPKGSLLYVWAEQDYLKAFNVTAAGVAQQPAATGPVAAPQSTGCPMSISANGSATGTGIVWASSPEGSGILRAFDAEDVSRELWNSQQNADRDATHQWVEFAAPTIVNGKVYMATAGGYLDVYGLLPD